MYGEYLKEHFQVEYLRKPMFSNLKNTIRIHVGEGYLEELAEAIRKNIEIYENLFENEDEIFLATYTDFENEIESLSEKFNHYLKKRDKNKKASVKIVSNRYPEEYEDDELDAIKTKEISLKTKSKNVDIKKLIKEKLKNYHYDVEFELGELYIVNITKGIIFHPYDDRGADVALMLESDIKVIEGKLKEINGIEIFINRYD